MQNLFYRNPRLLVVTLALIVVSGLAAFTSLPRMEDPRFANRNAVVVTRWKGASAERVEALVTRKLEEELQKVSEMKEIISSSRAGVSVISLELADRVDEHQVDEVWSRVRDKVDDARGRLPVGAEEPAFSNDETFAYTLIAALVWELPEARVKANHAILGRLAEELEDRLRGLPGTESTSLFGDQNEEIRVEVDASRLTALGLTPAELARRVEETDAKVAAGSLRTGTGDFLIEVEGEVDGVDRLRNTLVQSGDGAQFVNLGDIADVRKTVVDPPSEVAWIGGKPAVTVAARMEPGRRVDRWAAEARRAIQDFRSQLSQGVGLEIVFDQSTYTERRLSNLTRSFLLGVTAVIAVIFLTMGWRSALLVGSALPLSALFVLSGMRWLDIPIHQISVAGLIIALGLLIDNAIVMVDETRSRLEDGVEPAAAVSASVRHLSVPLLGSTLTTVLAFLPIVLMPGGAGEFVGPLALSVILALAGSLFLSLTVIPAMTAWLAGTAPRQKSEPAAPTGGRAAGREAERPFGRPAEARKSQPWWRRGLASERLETVYREALTRMVARPVLGIGVSLVLPILGFVAAAGLTEQFFPPADRDQFQVQLRLSRETPIGRTQEYARRLRELALEQEQVTDVHWFIGNSAPLFYYNMLTGADGSSFYAQALVQMRCSDDSPRIIRELQRKLDEAFPEAQILVLQLEQGPPFQAPIELELYGPDLVELRRLGDEARQILSEVPDVLHTRASLIDGHPRLWLELDEEEAHLAGFYNVGIARQLEATLEGAVGGSLLESTEELPIRVRLHEAERSDMNHLGALNLYTPEPQGAELSNVPLAALGELELRPQRVSIERRNGRRSNTVMGHIPAGVLPSSVLAKYRKELARRGFTLPPGFSMEWAGESGKRDDAVNQLMSSVAVLLVLMVASLVLSLGSFRLTAVIGVVGLASVGLGLGALWLFGYPFGFMAIVGTMGLFGVAINDAIVVSAALTRDKGARRGEPQAVVDVVVRSTRHVVSTTLTTVAGFTPLLLAGGGFWPPVATIISAGVVGATLMALTFVPTAFLWLRRQKELDALTEMPLPPCTSNGADRRTAPVAV